MGMRPSISPIRIAVLAIVALTLAAVAGLVGTDENEGALTNATQALAEKAARSSGGDTQSSAQSVAPVQTNTAPPAAPPMMEGDFAEDEGLIDDATGFDPSPFSEDPAQGEVVAIIEDDGSDTSAAPVIIEEP